VTNKARHLLGAALPVAAGVGLTLCVLAAGILPATGPATGSDTSRFALAGNVTRVVPGSAGCGRPLTAGTTDNTLYVRGVKRSYLLVVPAGLNPLVPVPVILGFHGGSDTGLNASRYMGLTGTEAALYVYPQAPYWPAADGVGWDVSPLGVDFPYVDQVLAELGARYCVDASRIFATGKSNGAFFVNALACYRPGLLRGIAPVAGGGPSGNCTVAVSAMVIHGTADTVVPLASGRQSRDYWLAANRYAGAPGVPVSPAPCVSYPGTARPVLWCQHGGGHVWPDWAGAGIRHFFLAAANTRPGAASGLTVTPSVLLAAKRFTSSATPALSGRASDPDGDTVQLKAEVWAWNGTAPTGTAPVTSGYTPFVASGTPAGWVVGPALVNGRAYAWRAATFDGTNWNGTWSPWQPFTVGAAAAP
jgi:polyhydroxybutyrate depolymerase